MKITKVYTRTGDQGKTSLVGGERVSKDDARLEAYGTVDELSSHVGLLASMLDTNDRPANPNTNTCTQDSRHLQRIQSTLFRLGGHLATDSSTTPLYPSTQVPKEEILWLEQQIDLMLAHLPEQHGFILPGGTLEAAECHICRTVCRRAERCIVALAKVAHVGQEEQKYVNRLSDYFFVLAELINFNAGKSEILWKSDGD
jgi:cob(I)alamin adenosyltransferase